MKIYFKLLLCLFLFVVLIPEVSQGYSQRPNGFVEKEKLAYITAEAKVQVLVNKTAREYEIPRKEELVRAVTDASLKNNVDPEIILSVIAVESAFKKGAKSHAGAVGPMQVIPFYWGKKGHNPYEYYENIQLGTKILREYKEECGNWKCAFKSYNVGITAYNKNMNVSAQKRYFAKIESQLRKYQYYI